MRCGEREKKNKEKRKRVSYFNSSSGELGEARVLYRVGLQEERAFNRTRRERKQKSLGSSNSAKFRKSQSLAKLLPLTLFESVPKTRYES